MAAAEDLEVQRNPMRPIWGVQPGSAAPGQSRRFAPIGSASA